MRFLLKAKDPDGHPALETSGQVRHMGFMRDLVDRNSLRKFKRRYKKLARISGYWHREPDRLRSKLSFKGIAPVWDPQAAGAEIYRVTDL